MLAETQMHFKDALIVLGAASVAIPLLKRLGLNNILAFMILGVILGPSILGQLANYIPGLSSLAINDKEAIGPLAELGVVFLLFLIGLELSPERLLTMKRLVFGLGGLQVLLCLAFLAATILALGYSDREALVLGMALSLSSTAVVIQLFTDEKRLGSQSGRVSFAILLMQDLAVIPMLMLVAILAKPAGADLGTGIGLALLQAAAAAAAIVLIGRYALRPILKLVSIGNSPELFLSAVLFSAIGTGALATYSGLSMSLGAFIAGLMLAETEYRRAIEAIIEPFKGLLLGLFFLLVGLSLDLPGFFAQPAKILGLVISIFAIKAAVIYGLARFFKVPRHAALESAVLLAPCGEFAFVIIAAAVASGTMRDATATPYLLVVSLTMLAIPLFSRLVRPFVSTLRKTAPDAPLPLLSLEQDPKIIIAGFGRVGKLLASMVDEHKLPWLAIDEDVRVVTQNRTDGFDINYGNAADPQFLRACGLETADAFAITMDNPARVEEIVKTARKLNPKLKIIARARDERHAMRLYIAGVTEAVPETIESSLQLGEALLVEAGVPMGLAIAAVHERRDGFRKLLGRPNRREAASSARRKLRNRLPK